MPYNGNASGGNALPAHSSDSKFLSGSSMRRAGRQTDPSDWRFVLAGLSPPMLSSIASAFVEFIAVATADITDIGTDNSTHPTAMQPAELFDRSIPGIYMKASNTSPSTSELPTIRVQTREDFSPASAYLPQHHHHHHPAIGSPAQHALLNSQQAGSGHDNDASDYLEQELQVDGGDEPLWASVGREEAELVKQLPEAESRPHSRGSSAFCSRQPAAASQLPSGTPMKPCHLGFTSEETSSCSTPLKGGPRPTSDPEQGQNDVSLQVQALRQLQQGGPRPTSVPQQGQTVASEQAQDLRQLQQLLQQPWGLPPQPQPHRAAVESSSMGVGSGVGIGVGVGVGMGVGSGINLGMGVGVGMCTATGTGAWVGSTAPEPGSTPSMAPRAGGGVLLTECYTGGSTSAHEGGPGTWAEREWDEAPLSTISNRPNQPSTRGLGPHSAGPTAAQQQHQRSQSHVGSSPGHVRGAAPGPHSSGPTAAQQQRSLSPQGRTPGTVKGATPGPSDRSAAANLSSVFDAAVEHVKGAAPGPSDGIAAANLSSVFDAAVEHVKGAVSGPSDGSTAANLASIFDAAVKAEPMLGGGAGVGDGRRLLSQQSFPLGQGIADLRLPGHLPGTPVKAPGSGHSLLVFRISPAQRCLTNDMEEALVFPSLASTARSQRETNSIFDPPVYTFSPFRQSPPVAAPSNASSPTQLVQQQNIQPNTASAAAAAAVLATQTSSPNTARQQDDELKRHLAQLSNVLCRRAQAPPRTAQQRLVDELKRHLAQLSNVLCSYSDASSALTPTHASPEQRASMDNIAAAATAAAVAAARAGYKASAAVAAAFGESPGLPAVPSHDTGPQGERQVERLAHVQAHAQAYGHAQAPAGPQAECQAHVQAYVQAQPQSGSHAECQGVSGDPNEDMYVSDPFGSSLLTNTSSSRLFSPLTECSSVPKLASIATQLPEASQAKPPATTGIQAPAQAQATPLPASFAPLHARLVEARDKAALRAAAYSNHITTVSLMVERFLAEADAHDASPRASMGLRTPSALLSLSINLDGEIPARVEANPPHLRPHLGGQAHPASPGSPATGGATPTRYGVGQGMTPQNMGCLVHPLPQRMIGYEDPILSKSTPMLPGCRADSSPLTSSLKERMARRSSRANSHRSSRHSVRSADLERAGLAPNQDMDDWSGYDSELTHTESFMSDPVMDHMRIHPSSPFARQSPHSGLLASPSSPLIFPRVASSVQSRHSRRSHRSRRSGASTIRPGSPSVAMSDWSGYDSFMTRSDSFTSEPFEGCKVHPSNPRYQDEQSDNGMEDPAASQHRQPSATATPALAPSALMRAPSEGGAGISVDSSTTDLSLTPASAMGTDDTDPCLSGTSAAARPPRTSTPPLDGTPLKSYPQSGGPRGGPHRLSVSSGGGPSRSVGSESDGNSVEKPYPLVSLVPTLTPPSASSVTCTGSSSSSDDLYHSLPQCRIHPTPPPSPAAAAQTPEDCPIHGGGDTTTSAASLAQPPPTAFETAASSSPPASQAVETAATAAATAATPSPAADSSSKIVASYLAGAGIGMHTPGAASLGNSIARLQASVLAAAGTMGQGITSGNCASEERSLPSGYVSEDGSNASGLLQSDRSSRVWPSPPTSPNDGMPEGTRQLDALLAEATRASELLEASIHSLQDASLSPGSAPTTTSFDYSASANAATPSPTSTSSNAPEPSPTSTPSAAPTSAPPSAPTPTLTSTSSTALTSTSSAAPASTPSSTPTPTPTPAPASTPVSTPTATERSHAASLSPFLHSSYASAASSEGIAAIANAFPVPSNPSNPTTTATKGRDSASTSSSLVKDHGQGQGQGQGQGPTSAAVAGDRSLSDPSSGGIPINPSLVSGALSMFNPCSDSGPLTQWSGLQAHSSSTSSPEVAGHSMGVGSWHVHADGETPPTSAEPTPRGGVTKHLPNPNLLDAALRGSMESVNSGCVTGRVEGMSNGNVRGSGEGIRGGNDRGSLDSVNSGSVRSSAEGISGENVRGSGEGVSGGNVRGSAEGVSGGNVRGSAEGVSGGNVRGSAEGVSGGNVRGSAEGVSGGNVRGSAEGVSGGSVRGISPTPCSRSGFNALYVRCSGESFGGGSAEASGQAVTFSVNLRGSGDLMPASSQGSPSPRSHSPSPGRLLHPHIHTPDTPSTPTTNLYKSRRPGALNVHAPPSPRHAGLPRGTSPRQLPSPKSARGTVQGPRIPNPNFSLASALSATVSNFLFESGDDEEEEEEREGLPKDMEHTESFPSVVSQN
eukprot:gene17178-23492_t